MRIPVGDAANAIGAKIIGHVGIVCDGVSYDSRSLRPGNLFVAIVAARDGHEFVYDAVRAGCSAVLVSREVSDCPVPQLVVPDTSVGLTELGRFARGRLASGVDGRVVGITGSVGKTSTKDFVAAALGSHYRVGASEKSLNNDQGMPVTLLNAPDDAGALVLEMGMRGFGEIARLARLARPDIGVVTRVGESHGERVGGIEGIARAKGELVEALPLGGYAVLNADDHRVLAMRDLTDAHVCTFGMAEGADMRVVDAVQRGASGIDFRYESRWGSGTCWVAVPGLHMASNAAAALLVAAVAGCKLDEAAAALASTVRSPMRMQIHEVGGLTIIDDTYNASPASAKAALDAMASIPSSRRVAVLGAMAEIQNPEREHQSVRHHAEDLGIEVYAFGTDLYGAPSLESDEDVVALVRHLPEGSSVLFKASRAVGLDRIVRLVIG